MTDTTTTQAKHIKTMTTARLQYAARNYRNVMLEGGEGYNPYQEELNRRRAEGEHREWCAGRDAAFRDEWTPEVFVARRAAWNAEVQSRTVNGKIGFREIQKIERKLGFTFRELQDAKQLPVYAVIETKALPDGTESADIIDNYLTLDEANDVAKEHAGSRVAYVVASASGLSKEWLDHYVELESKLEDEGVDLRDIPDGEDEPEGWSAGLREIGACYEYYMADLDEDTTVLVRLV